MPHQATGRPLVALVSEMSGAEQRFAVLHELGHLIFDQGLVSPIRGGRNPAEQRAHHFARAMLLPRDGVIDQLSESLNLQGYLGIKAQFGAPVASIIKRARDLKLISVERERSLFIQWSSQAGASTSQSRSTTRNPFCSARPSHRSTAATAASQAAILVFPLTCSANGRRTQTVSRSALTRSNPRQRP